MARTLLVVEDELAIPALRAAGLGLASSLIALAVLLLRRRRQAVAGGMG